LSTGTTENRADAVPPEWCGQCDKHTRHLNTKEGPIRCACHPGGRLLPQHRLCPDCYSVIHKWDRNECESHIPVRSAA
jgi:hypothetical protein